VSIDGSDRVITEEYETRSEVLDDVEIMLPEFFVNICFVSSEDKLYFVCDDKFDCCLSKRFFCFDFFFIC
jgi:hypothetical protein